LKISGGSLKGRKIGSRKLFSGKNSAGDLRPTSAKVREALFDILRNDITDASFLDLYAGTGTVGIEALSRGAAKTFLIEQDAVRFGLIKESVDRMDLGARAVLLRRQVLDFLKNASAAQMTFNIIFADPPYASDETDKVIAFIDSKHLLSNNGCLVIEHSSKKILDNKSMQTIQFIKNYKYGDTMLTLYRKVI
jgi:16S rRNA (guanine(966)-N(2))-methyltransferase RsmD